MMVWLLGTHEVGGFEISDGHLLAYLTTIHRDVPLEVVLTWMQGIANHIPSAFHDPYGSP
jgi:hypothetical protein